MNDLSDAYEQEKKRRRFSYSEYSEGAPIGIGDALRSRSKRYLANCANELIAEVEDVCDEMSLDEAVEFIGILKDKIGKKEKEIKREAK